MTGIKITKSCNYNERIMTEICNNIVVVLLRRLQNFPKINKKIFLQSFVARISIQSLPTATTPLQRPLFLTPFNHRSGGTTVFAYPYILSSYTGMYIHVSQMYVSRYYCKSNTKYQKINLL